VKWDPSYVVETAYISGGGRHCSLRFSSCDECSSLENFWFFPSRSVSARLPECVNEFCEPSSAEPKVNWAGFATAVHLIIFSPINVFLLPWRTQPGNRGGKCPVTYIRGCKWIPPQSFETWCRTCTRRQTQ
jgi:hypothetical protein